MGGWRKLWFVLQNQLLLSYSSKEDYEKKLAPFKDVLNLVPGVIVRPTKGPRFTIETPTNLIYTYVIVNCVFFVPLQRQFFVFIYRKQIFLVYPIMVFCILKSFFSASFAFANYNKLAL